MDVSRADAPSIRRRGGPQSGVARYGDVVRAALEVTRRASLDELTVRAVADTLGITSPAVYHHVPGGRQALVEIVVDHVLESADARAIVQRDGESWLDRLERIVFVIAQTCSEYPGVLPYLVSAGRNRKGSMRGSDLIARQLFEGGFTPARAAKAFDGISALVSGWALMQRQSVEVARALGYRDLTRVLAARTEADENDLRLCLRSMIEGLRTEAKDPRR